MALIALAIATTPENHLRVSPLIGGLALMKVLQPSLFNQAKESRLTYAEVQRFLPLAELEADTESSWGWACSWWQYVTDANAPQELIQEMRRGLFSFSIGDRLDILSYTADSVMDNVSMR